MTSFTELVVAAAVLLGVSPWALAAGPPALVDAQLQVAARRGESMNEAAEDAERGRRHAVAMAASRG